MLNIFIFSLWYRCKARRWVSPLNLFSGNLGILMRARCLILGSQVGTSVAMCGVYREVKNIYIFYLNKVIRMSETKRWCCTNWIIRMRVCHHSEKKFWKYRSKPESENDKGSDIWKKWSKNGRGLWQLMWWKRYIEIVTFGAPFSLLRNSA